MMSNLDVHQSTILVESNESNKVPVLIFVFKDGTKRPHPIGCLIRGMQHDGSRPVGVEWYSDSIGYIPSNYEVKWIMEQLINVFDKSVKFENAIKGLLNE